MPVNGRNKGKAGEREAIGVLQPIVDRVYSSLGFESPVLERNLSQTRGGGYDLQGLPWLAVEVKRQESIQVNQWWNQTLRQAQEGQVPLLMWRVNRKPWNFRTRLPVVIGTFMGTPATGPKLDIDLNLNQFELFLESEINWRLINART